MQQKSNAILSKIASISAKGRRVQRVYRLLFDKSLWERAYGKLAPNEGNMTAGTDGSTIDGFNWKQVDEIIEQLKYLRYYPKPVRRTYIPKSNGKKRPLGIPNFSDKLLQEVLRLILNAIYEPHFKDTSHGFRPNRSCHTALKQIQRKFIGTKWFVEGDIKSYFDTIDHSVLLSELAKRIEDKRFICLIHRFLKAGYLEDFHYHKTYSGTPQGGIVSPILANVYLHELDAFMENYATTFNKGPKRRINLEYNRIAHRKERLRKKLKKMREQGEKGENITRLIKEIKEVDKEMKKLPSKDPRDPNFRRLSYCRYADDFLVGIIGSKEDAQAVKKDIKEFLSNGLNLELSDDKTLITHIRDGASFLGYNITTYHPKASKQTHKRRSTTGKIKLSVPKEVAEKYCQRYTKNGKVVAMSSITRNSDVEILLYHNAIYRGIYNYYSIANDVSGKLSKLQWYTNKSFFKTLAYKHKTSSSKMVKKLRRGNKFCITVKVKGKEKRYTLFTERKKVDIPHHTTTDYLPNVTKYTGGTELIKRLNAQTCEWCGISAPNCEVHHIRKLKELNKRTHLTQWQKKMIARRRKTLVLCINCHNSLHAGKLN